MISMGYGYDKIYKESKVEGFSWYILPHRKKLPDHKKR